MKLTNAEMITIMRRRLSLKMRDVARRHDITTTKLSNMETGKWKEPELMRAIISDLKLLTKAREVSDLRRRLGHSVVDVADMYGINVLKIKGMERGVDIDEALCDRIIENLQGELDAIACGDGEPQFDKTPSEGFCGVGYP